MPRRKHYRKNKFKLKLKKGTIYSIFAFGFIVVGIILLLSFTKNGNSFLMINNLLGRYFGSVAILFPFVLIFFGFLFLKLRLFLSGINVSIGFLLFFISLDALLKQGMAGKEFPSPPAGWNRRGVQRLHDPSLQCLLPIPVSLQEKICSMAFLFLISTLIGLFW